MVKVTYLDVRLTRDQLLLVNLHCQFNLNHLRDLVTPLNVSVKDFLERVN